jgi:hypothetical protein
MMKLAACGDTSPGEKALGNQDVFKGEATGNGLCNAGSTQRMVWDTGGAKEE